MATPSQPVDVVVRFSNSTPDIILHIATPNATSILSLKQSLREHVPPPANTARLRFIHAGKVLADTTALFPSVTFHSPPQTSDKAKGKQPVREIPRIYIHCSIGDVLTPAELAAEATAASDADAAIAAHIDQPAVPSEQHGQTSTTTPAPRGFDRLLSAGFTNSEVTALRSQLLAIQSHSNTPETMPTGPELLALEERWLDGSSNASTEGMGSDETGALEDILYGNLIGFFWPLGAVWLLREEGVWSRRKQVAVFTGFLVNLMFGFMRLL
jgi:hypothetical protein